MKYKLVTWIFAGSSSGGVSIDVLEFFDKAQAEAAELTLKGKVHCYIMTDKLFSIESLFVDLLKANPVESPANLLKRATEAYNLVYPKAEETKLESWSQKIANEK